MSKDCKHEFRCGCDSWIEIKCIKCTEEFTMIKLNEYINTLRARIVRLEKGNNDRQYKSIPPLQQESLVTVVHFSNY